MKQENYKYLEHQYDLWLRSAAKTIKNRKLFDNKNFMKTHHRICRRIRFASGGML